MFWGRTRLLIQTDLKFTVQLFLLCKLYVLANEVFHIEKLLKCHLEVIDGSKYLVLIAARKEECVLLCSIALKSEKSE